MSGARPAEWLDGWASFTFARRQTTVARQQRNTFSTAGSACELVAIRDGTAACDRAG